MVPISSYETHITGLRAVAVIGVLLYHLGVPGVSGGFAGVDVFFVISGFLITRKIADEIAASGRFRFGSFYLARARRLLPALLATLGVSMAAAVLLLPGASVEAIGMESFAALFSFSNILFWLQAGYFDGAGEMKPLLHTWSLGVEAQFYLVWPALLLLTATLIRRLWAGVTMLGALSLGAALWVLATSPVWLHEPASATFYLTPFRVYEFALGALVVPLSRRIPASPRLHETMMVAGLGLIAGSFLLIDADMAWPSYLALVPCVGAALVILAPNAHWSGKTVVNPVSVWIGLVSYSLYLVHWPLIVFYRYLTFSDPGLWNGMVLFAAAVGLAAISYYFVEQPVRRRTSWAFPRFVPIAAAASVLALVAAGCMSQGVVGRPSPLSAQQIAEGKERRFELFQRPCYIQWFGSSIYCPTERPLQVLVFGDSHEPDAYTAFFTAYGNSPDINFVVFGNFNGCEARIVEGGFVSDNPRSACDERFAHLGRIIRDIDVVVFGAHLAFEEWGAPGWLLVEHMTRLNPALKLVVMGGYLNTAYDCADLYNRFGRLDACTAPAFVRRANFNERRNPDRPPQTDTLDYLYIDEMALLCPDGVLRSCVADANGEPIFYDRHHRSFGLSQMIGVRMAEAYGEDLEALGFSPSSP